MRVAFIIFLFSFSLLFGGSNSPKEVCNISKSSEFKYYSKQKAKAIIPETFIIGKNKIEIKLKNTNFPSGYNLVAFLDVLEFTSETEPEVENDIPFLEVEFFEKGEYKLLLNVNLTYRSS